jgi:hypothetical protein
MIELLIVLVVCGLALYLVEALIPMAPPFPMLIRVVVGLVCLLYLLRLIGFGAYLPAHLR